MKRRSLGRSWPTERVFAPLPIVVQLLWLYLLINGMLWLAELAHDWGGVSLANLPMKAHCQEFIVSACLWGLALLWREPVVAIGSEIRIVNLWRYAQFPRMVIRSVTGEPDDGGLVIYAGGGAFTPICYQSIGVFIKNEKFQRYFGAERRYAQVAEDIRQWAFSGSDGSHYGSALLAGGRVAGKHSMAPFLPPGYHLARWRTRPFAVFSFVCLFGGIPWAIARLHYV